MSRAITSRSMTAARTDATQEAKPPESPASAASAAAAVRAPISWLTASAYADSRSTNTVSLTALRRRCLVFGI